MKAPLIILMLAATFAAGHTLEPCDTCPEGFVPGTGTVTVSYTMRLYQDAGDACGIVLCSRVDLDGTIQTDGLASYDGVPVVVNGTRLFPDNSCCTEGVPTTVDLEGVILASFDDVDGFATALVEYWPLDNPSIVEFADFGPDSASCTRYTKSRMTFNEGTQIIETLTVTFNGGECVDDPDDPTDPPDPPDDPPDGPGDTDPPDVEDPPDHDPPDDPPEPPDLPDPPDDPVPPDPPEPPAPPIDDACCIAITSRLDILISFAGDEATLNRNRNTYLSNISDQLEAFYAALISPDLGVNGILPNMQIALYDVRAYLSQMQAFMRIDQQYQFDQTWYLEQIYASGIQIAGGDFVEPTAGDDYDFGSSAGAIAGLVTTHADNQIEHQQEFGLPDLDTYADPENAAIWNLSLSFARAAGLDIGDITLDLSPYTTVRNLVHSAILILVSLNAIRIVWEEFRKT